MVPLRVLMLLGGGMLAVFGSEAIELPGAGPLAVVAASFVSCYFWQKEGWEVDDVSIDLRRSFCPIKSASRSSYANSVSNTYISNII